MKAVFADSYYFFALLNKKEPRHDKAVEFADSYEGDLILTPWILTEVGDGLANPGTRQVFLGLRQELLKNPHVCTVPCSDRLFEAGIDLYGQRQDKSWSLTDCISFVVMTEEGLTEALTADHHFEQSGFKALLK